MQNISIGKMRALQQCTSSKRIFTCLALDHRQNLRKINPVFQSDNELSRFKLDIAHSLAAYSSAVLLDPEVSAAQAVASGVLPGDKGLVVALESTGYGGGIFARETRILSGWNVEKARRMGASMIKLLVYYHPESKIAKNIEELICRVAEECQISDIGLMLEPLTYSLNEKNLTDDEKRSLVVETARKLTAIQGIDILKSELPSNPANPDLTRLADACAEVSSVSSIPWILLSASVPFDQFFEQVRIACQAGASGVAVGRAVWQETVSMGYEERKTFLSTTGKERLERLSALCNSYGRPWTDFYSAEAGFDWYKNY